MQTKAESFWQLQRPWLRLSRYNWSSFTMKTISRLVTDETVRPSVFVYNINWDRIFICHKDDVDVCIVLRAGPLDLSFWSF